MNKRLVGFYDYTVILTYLGMIAAFTGIIMALNESYSISLICIMIAGTCDMFDGAVASTKERNQQEKHFGLQIDSFCDLISFGILPAIFSYQISGKKCYVGVLAGLYVLCALIRLSYYNVLEIDRQQESDERGKGFLGVPVTVAAFMLPMMYIAQKLTNVPADIIFAAIIVVMGCAFVLKIRVKKPQVVGKIVLIAIGVAELVTICLLYM